MSMGRITWLFLLAGLLVGWSYPQTALYGFLKGNGYPLLTSAGALDPAIADSIARFDVVILDAPAPKQRPWMLDSLRKRNPDIRLYGYIMEGVYWVNPHPALGDTTTDLPWHIWQAVRGTGGPLLDTSGRSMGTNVASVRQMRAMAEVYVRDVVRPGLWDGLFVDVACARTWGIQFGDQTVDLARMGFRSPEEFNRAWAAGSDTFIAVLRSAVGDSFPIIGNCGPSGQPSFSGWMRENFPWQGVRDPEQAWEESMIVNGFGQPGYLMAPLVYTHHIESWLAWEPGYDRNAPENLRRGRFTLASSLLGEGVACVGRHEWEAPRFWWFAEYGPPGSHWLGESRGAAHLLDNGLWVRYFQNGVVVVNPTFVPLSLYLQDRYRPIGGGAWKRAFVAPSRDGLFLRR